MSDPQAGFGVVKDDIAQILIDRLKKLELTIQSTELVLKEMKQLFDGSVIAKRYNQYKIYTIDTNVAQALPALLFDATQEMGGYPMHRLQVLAPGGGVGHLYINSPTQSIQLTFALLATVAPTAQIVFEQFDIYKVYYDVTTAAQGTAIVFMAGWIK